MAEADEDLSLTTGSRVDEPASSGVEVRPSAADQFRTGLFLLALLVVLVAALLLIGKVLLTDTDLGLRPVRPNQIESEALIRTNERIVQLVQWTISTILVVAGGLLGLNWYQNQKRYENDKADLIAFRQHMERRYRRDLADLTDFREQLQDRVSSTERAQERLAEHHRSHLLVQAVDELGRTSTVQEAFAVIASWYGQIREADNERQERALSLLWQGFEFIEEMIVEKKAPPVFFPDVAGAEERFLALLVEFKETYPDVREFTQPFRDMAA